ncbi:hypothetical protein PEDI_50420 [Persicobacter diffluens]|uniref:Uncharacterized protein n=1 Tax=Persicobacter diffluens TaxID=981 RepID=A0AAN4W5I9_9BACT|nr:hypothetical protein PEDI_50420 [Persicobacter diffluens]
MALQAKNSMIPEVFGQLLPYYVITKSLTSTST